MNFPRCALGCATLAALLLASSSALAQAQPVADPTKTAAQPAAPPQDKPPAPAPSAFTYTLAYDLDLLADVSGGLSRGGGRADLLKASVGYDGTLTGHEGLMALMSVEHTFGSAFTARRVGGFQAVTNAEAEPPATRLYEAWVEQDFYEGAAGVKVGLIDLNTTFDVQETAGLFLNASNGTGPDLSDTGLNGPSIYPSTALAVNLFWRPLDDWTVQAGVFDATAGDPAHRRAFAAVKLDGALLIGQVERRFGDAARLEFGAWTYTKRYPSLVQQTPAGAPRDIGGNSGIYALAEGRLLGGGGDDGGLSGWVRVGVGNAEINPVRDYLGMGLVYSGRMFGRDKDQAGLALNSAGMGKGARAAGLAAGRTISGRETVVEATYRYAWTDQLALQPDVQYVFRPHGDARIRDAIVAGLRVAFTWSR